MNITLSYIPNINYFLQTIDKCTGYVFLELKDKSYLNMKENGEGRCFLEDMGHHPNGLHVLTEKENDAFMLAEALMTS